MDIEINRKKKFYRLYEFLPGILTWLAFILPIIFSIFYPVFIASLIIIYALVWLIRAIMMSVRLIIAYKKYKKNVKIDWFLRTKEKFASRWKDIYHVAILATYKEDIETLQHSLKALAQSNYDTKKIIFVLATEERDKDNVRIIAKSLQT